MSNKKVGREKSICVLRRLQYTGQTLLPFVTFVHIKIQLCSFTSSVYMRGGGGGQWTLGVAFSSLRNHLIAIFEVLTHVGTLYIFETFQIMKVIDI